MSESTIDRLVDQLGVAEAASRCKVAGVLFTYRCNIRCQHCLFGCAADRPDVMMTPQQCAGALELLRATGRVVHIAGGEPMVYWEELAKAIRLSARSGAPPHFVETNCLFAVSDEVARRRLHFMATNGVRGIYASSDPYHQEFVPPENFLRVRRIGREIFGEKNFYGSAASEEDVRQQGSLSDDATSLREYVRSHPPGMMGSARERLGPYLDRYSPGDPALPAHGWGGPVDPSRCEKQFAAESMWEVHVDPYGNILTNCGMILGNLSDTTPVEVLESGPENANRFVRSVCEGGARGLAELARRDYGFQLPPSVTQTCELCYLARHHLRRFHPGVFGPAEIYGEGKEKSE